MKNNRNHLAKWLISGILYFIPVLLFIQSCNTHSNEVENNSNLLTDSVSVKLQCFDADYVSSDKDTSAEKRILASIVFSGTVKEMGMPKKDVSILVFDATDKNVVPSGFKSDVNGKYSFSNQNVVYPIKIIADNGSGYYLDILLLKSPILSPDTVIDFNLIPYESSVNMLEHNLNVKLKRSIDGSPLFNRKVTFSSDILGNTWYVNTNSRGLANFSHLDKKATVCSVYTDKNSVPNFNFSMLGISRKANIATEIVIPN